MICQNTYEKEVMTKTLENYTKDELIEIIKNLRHRKKFGLVWEDKPEEIVRLCETELPVLEEVSTRAIEKVKDAPTNVLIEGDNYHSLSALNYTHTGKIDLIYIDPPYNTGNKDFIYNDNYIDTDDTFRHSKWLSFMAKRLELARNLLATDGMIFISIDDNELSNLRLLCDDIFGSENFINCISVKTKAGSGASGGGEDKKLKKNIEYLLFYSKNKSQFKYKTTYVKTSLMEVIEEKRENGKQFEYTKALVSKGKLEYVKSIVDGSGGDIKIYRHNGYVVKTIKQLMKEENLTEKEVYNKYFGTIFRATNAQTSIRQRVRDAMPDDNGLLSIEYVPRSGKNKGLLTKNYYIGNSKDLFVWLSDVAEKGKSDVFKNEKLGTFWGKLSWNGLANEGGVVFSNGKKPVAFIEKIIEHHPKNNTVVLDFFAGSGTTGQAVLDMNAADGGSRSVILCTSNENNIAEDVTYTRMYNVINGYSGRSGMPANLRYFKTSLVSKQQTDDQTRIELVARSTDMICLREDTFEKIVNTKLFKVFGNADHYAAIVFEPDAIVLFKDALAKLKDDKSIHIYVFSLSNDTYESDFTDLEREHELRPIPESILEVYRRIHKQRHSEVGVYD